jgi:hypothetical protein
LRYDARNLYVIFLAFDDEPQNVRANLAPRVIGRTAAGR